MTKILITGGAGFVGSRLALALVKKNPLWEIVCFDNLRRRGSEINLIALKENGIKFIHGDIRIDSDLEEVGNFDYMIECSAEPSVLSGINNSPDYLIETNLSGAINCFNLARKNNAKIIFMSTSRVYPLEDLMKIELLETENRFVLDKKSLGATEEGINEEFPLNLFSPRSLYGFTKLSAEMLLQEYKENYGLKFIINRCGILTGPGQFGKSDQGVVMFWLLNHYFKKEVSYIGFNGEGKQVRDFLHIDDFANLIEKQIKSFDSYNGSTFIVGGGIKNSFSLKELTKVCEEITGNKLNIGREIDNRKSDVPWIVLDSSKTQLKFNWTPCNNLQDTIEDMFKWIKMNELKLRELVY